MKTQIKKESVEFQPVTLEITFETKEELKVFHDMMCRDMTIPAAVYPGDYKEGNRYLLSQMMIHIQNSILNKID